VAFDGLDADRQDLGDLLRRVALGHQLENPSFAGGEYLGGEVDALADAIQVAADESGVSAPA
jgi:hypothetical protein